MLVLGRAAESLRACGATNPIVPVYSDLATNNFNQVSSNLAGAKALAAQQPNQFPLIAPGSFYGPLMPPGSVQLGFSFNSVCWLDRLPSEPIPDFVIYPGAVSPRPDVRVSPEAVQAFTAQAEQDLTRFLEYRAAEMVTGARLLLAVPGRNAQYWTGGGIYDLLHDACVDLVQAGRIDRAAYERTVMPVYFRTVEELTAPLERPGTPLAQALEVLESVCLESATSFVVDYQATGNLQRYVDEYVGFVQAFSEPVMRAGLEPASGADAVSAIYPRAKEILAAAPQNYPFRYLQAVVLLQRTAA